MAEMTPVDVPGPAPSSARTPTTIQVGPARRFRTPSQGAAVAQAGDIIEIDSAAYVGDAAIWRADNLTIRGAGGRAKLFAAGESVEGKAIWVIKGRNAVVENIEFANAEVGAGNGAGIRAEGIDLRIVNCYFHDNQEGILSSIGTPDSTIDIENSEFARNGGNGGQSHEIYINNIRQLIVRGSYFHAGNIGHLIKSRAQRNMIVGNRITDEAGGGASYELEFPNGGFNIVAENLIEQSAGTQNSTILANALEGASNRAQELYVVNNTFVNDLGRGDFIRAQPPSVVHATNNIFIGAGNVLVGNGRLRNNLLAAGVGGAPRVERKLFRDEDLADQDTLAAQDAGLIDPARYDYRLRPNSPAIGKGIDPGAADGVSLLPAVEYIHPTATKLVETHGAIDIGAYQRGR